MRKIIRDGAIVVDDWLDLDATAPIPPQGKIIVPLARWLEEKPALLERVPRGVGVRLGPDHDPFALASDLPALALIAVEFPVFRDGRGYSIARILRQHLGFRGELRAVGDVLRDQVFYLRRVGFNAFAPRPGLDPEQVLAGLNDFSDAYQPAADDIVPIWRRRQPAPVA